MAVRHRGPPAVAKAAAGKQTPAMRITCPSCAAEYEVPGPLAPGRAVRCARCGHQWPPAAPELASPEPARPEPAMEPEPEPVPWPAPAPEPPAPELPVTAPPVTAPPSRRPLALRVPPGAALALAWLGSAMLIAALVMAALVFRKPVMHAWPPSIRLFAALGLG